MRTVATTNEARAGMELRASVRHTNGTSLTKPFFHNSLRFKELHHKPPWWFNFLQELRLGQIWCLKLVPFLRHTDARSVVTRGPMVARSALILPHPVRS
jgi:hypothetical protein